MPAVLSNADMRSLLGAAEFVAAAESLEALRQRTVQVLPTLVETTQAAWNEVDFTGKRIDAVMAPDLDVLGLKAEFREMSEAFIKHVGDHPCIAYYVRTADGRPVAISDFINPSEFHATGLYRHFYRFLGVEDQLSFVLPDPALLVGITMNRAQTGFSNRDRRMCNLLRPHLLLAYKNVEVVSRVQRLLDTLDHLASGTGEEVILLNDRGSIEHLSPGAPALLRRFFDRVDPMMLARQFTSGSEDEGQNGTVIWPLIHRRDTSLLVARRVPFAGGHALLLSDQSAATPHAHLRRLGLSARESEVLGLIGEGLQTKGIAALLEISPRTVDKHVGRILDKLGVRNRISAIKLVSQTTESPARPRQP